MTTLPLWPDEPSEDGLIPYWPTPRATMGSLNQPSADKKRTGGGKPKRLEVEVGKGKSTSSPAAIPASRSLSPGSDWARKMTAISGRQLLHSLPSSNPLSACLRTLLVTSRWASTVCWLTWKRSATPAGRLLYRLVPSTPRTGETGFGLWPTPTATVGGNTCELTPHKGHFLRPSGEKAHLGLDQAVRMWPTPNVNSLNNRKEYETAGGDGLQTAVRRDAGILEPTDTVPVKLWPTPTTQDGENNGGPSQAMRNTPPLNSVIGGQLNPNWVEWLMGYPIGHTDLEH